jgi:DNA-binding MurR/RpiR family transcriptional regulator
MGGGREDKKPTLKANLSCFPDDKDPKDAARQKEIGGQTSRCAVRVQSSQDRLRPRAVLNQEGQEADPRQDRPDNSCKQVERLHFKFPSESFLFSRQASRTKVPSSIMNGTNVSNTILERLADELTELTPEARKAATYVLENPRDVGVSTVREIAVAAKVKPNTVVRMARQVGFEGYEDFRAPFREAIRRGAADFPDRARWLQDIRKSGDLGGLYADMVRDVLANIEETFADISTQDLKAAAEAIWAARRVFTLGVGVNNSIARNFTYLASTGMTEFHAIPRAGSTPVDDLAWADSQDVLIAITCKPYRSEVVEAVRIAHEQGMTIVALSDSPASPIIRLANHGFVVSVDTPQFFPSSVSIIALLETLLSFVIAVASDEIPERVATFHARRHELGLYYSEDK